MLSLCTKNYLPECWVTGEFWTSVWKVFWICHNKRDIVSAMQPPNTNSAKITRMWQKLRKARKLGVTRHSSNVNQSTLKRNKCDMQINSCSFQFPFLFWYYYIWYLHSQIYTFLMYLWFQSPLPSILVKLIMSLFLTLKKITIKDGCSRVIRSPFIMKKKIPSSSE